MRHETCRQQVQSWTASARHRCLVAVPVLPGCCAQQLLHETSIHCACAQRVGAHDVGMYCVRGLTACEVCQETALGCVRHQPVQQPALKLQSLYNKMLVSCSGNAGQSR